MTFEEYVEVVLYYVEHGDSFQVAHAYTCIGSGLSLQQAKEYKERLLNEVKI
jgi:hypothetical protein